MIEDKRLAEIEWWLSKSCITNDAKAIEVIPHLIAEIRRLQAQLSEAKEAIEGQISRVWNMDESLKAVLTKLNAGE